MLYLALFSFLKQRRDSWGPTPQWENPGFELRITTKESFLQQHVLTKLTVLDIWFSSFRINEWRAELILDIGVTCFIRSGHIIMHFTDALCYTDFTNKEWKHLGILFLNVGRGGGPLATCYAMPSHAKARPTNTPPKCLIV